jgi:hypothetical protein
MRSLAAWGASCQALTLELWRPRRDPPEPEWAQLTAAVAPLSAQLTHLALFWKYRRSSVPSVPVPSIREALPQLRSLCWGDRVGGVVDPNLVWKELVTAGAVQRGADAELYLPVASRRCAHTMHTVSSLAEQG